MLTYTLALYRGDTARYQFVLWADSARTVEVDLTGVVVAAEVRPSTGGTPLTLEGSTEVVVDSGLVPDAPPDTSTAAPPSTAACASVM